MRDSRTGYLLPARDAQGTLPDVESCWDAVAVVPVVAVAAAGAAAAGAAARRPPLAQQSISSDTTKYKFIHNKV